MVRYNYTISSEDALFGNYIKYVKMFELVSNSVLSQSNSNSINIFIDVYSLIQPIYRSDRLIYNDYACLCSCIINMCAHYREYFRRTHKVESKIFIVYSKNAPQSCTLFDANYNIANVLTNTARQDVNKWVEDNLSILNTLVPYLPNIYYVRDDSAEVGVIIDCIPDAIGDNSPNLVISKDPYMCLLAATGKAVIFRPKKDKEGDISYFIDYKNVWDVYRYILRIKRDQQININPELFPMALALSGARFRSVKAKIKFTTAINILSTAVSNGIILNQYLVDSDYALNSIISSGICMDDAKYNTYEITARYKALSLRYQSGIYRSSPSFQLIPSVMQDLYDPQSVQEINNTYFKSNPLDLNRL